MTAGGKADAHGMTAGGGSTAHSFLRIFPP
jgi:hypothetical protein